MSTAQQVFEQSDGSVTRQYYAQLERRGPVGTIAMNLFRAQKASFRAKRYRGGLRGRGSYRLMAYEKKQWSMDLLCKALQEHAAALGIAWGWGQDPAQPVHCWVLYVELPTGQVSFHTDRRGEGPDFDRGWDGKHESISRILAFCDQVADDDQPE